MIDDINIDIDFVRIYRLPSTERIVSRYYMIIFCPIQRLWLQNLFP